MSDSDYKWAKRTLDELQEHNFQGREYTAEELLALAYEVNNRLTVIVKPALQQLRAIQYAMSETEISE